MQYVIVAVVVAACVALAVRYLYREWRENVRYRNYGCAGCAFYDKCRRNKKITYDSNKQ